MKKEMSSHLVNSYRGESFKLYPIKVEGDNKVTQRPKYEDERVYINSSQYFTNVKEADLDFPVQFANY